MPLRYAPRKRIRAKTFTYGPEIEANVTTGPGEGKGALGGRGGSRPHHSPSAHTRQGLHSEGPVPPLAAKRSDEATVRLDDTSI